MLMLNTWQARLIQAALEQETQRHLGLKRTKGNVIPGRRQAFPLRRRNPHR